LRSAALLAPPLIAAIVTLSALTVAVRIPHTWPVSGPVGDGTKASRNRGWLATEGFYPPEYDERHDRQFSWTTGDASLLFDGLDRSVPWRLEFVAGAGRPPGLALPDVTIAVDGRLVATTRVGNQPAALTAELPQKQSTGARVSLRVAPVFSPGPRDRRMLGIMIERVSLAPIGQDLAGVAASRRLRAAGAAAALALPAALSGMSTVWACGLAAAVGAAFTWLLRFDMAVLG
jgi:hypothetical protein